MTTVTFPTRGRSLDLDHHDLLTVANAVDRHGIDAIDATTLAALAELARSLGLHPDVVSAITDRSTPAVVRNRIVGRLTVASPRPAPGSRPPVLAA
ncbi:MAG: hypothetical protein AAGA93_16490 [Actinomycetota bacterium]